MLFTGISVGFFFPHFLPVTFFVGCHPSLHTLASISNRLLITIEYDVSIVDTSRFVQSPLLVEVEKSPGAFLGISLISNPETNRGVYIESVAPASIAER